MKKYFKTGLATLIPVALVYQVGLWVFGFSQGVVNNVENMLSIDFAWYAPLLAIVGVLFIILTLGVVFNLKLFKTSKGYIETHVINRIPVVRNIYNFGKDVSESFISAQENTDNDELKIVEVYMGPITMLGVLTDVENSLVFVVSAPSPLTGFVMKTDNYKVLDMTFSDLVQINTSLGKINGGKWK